MTDLAILALRYGGGFVLVLCALWAGAAILMFNVDMGNARCAATRQRSLIGDLFWNLTIVLFVAGCAGFCVALSFTR